MCLFLNKIKTYQLKNNKTGRITVYKFLNVNTQELDGYSLLRAPYCIHYYKPGWNISDRKSTDLGRELFSERVHKGIHVCTTKNYAKQSKYVDEVVIKFYAYWKDFVAINNDSSEMVFTKVFLPKSEYSRVARQLKKRIK